jgi:hypothetical protein
MNFELLKQLQDAGFPFLEAHKREAHDGCPTLSELIEACGHNFGRLELDSKPLAESVKWCAFDAESYRPTGYYGSTPEGAVARLWLALKENEKCYCGGPIKKENVVHTMDCHLNEK